jgi:acetyl-CoA decarbonylase/synthase complex subunit gamma
MSATVLGAELKRLADYQIQRIGEELRIDMVHLQAAGGDFVAAAQVVRDAWPGAVALDSTDTEALRGAAELLRDRRPILFRATSENLDALVEVAKATGSALAVSAPSAEALAPLTEKAAAAGFKDLLLHVDTDSAARAMEQHTIIRRAALRKNFKPLGYPVVVRVDEGARDPAVDAALGVCKYASVILLPAFDPALHYPLLTLRQSIFTDPQKPIQVEPGVYPIGSPGPESPAFLTTNFSLTYFLVSGEIENSGTSAHLVVHDCEGMSVLTGWAAGKFTGAKVADFIKASALPGKESGRTLVIPGQAAVISGDLEEGLPDFKVLVGPPEAADIPAYVKQVLQ